jgi:hypothetical protein
MAAIFNGNMSGSPPGLQSPLGRLSRAALALTLAIATTGCAGPPPNLRAPSESVKRSIQKPPALTGATPNGEAQSRPQFLSVAHTVKTACERLGHLPTAADAASPRAQVYVLEKELRRLPRFDWELLALRLPKGRDAEARAALAMLHEKLRTYKGYLSSVIALDRRAVSDFKTSEESPDLAIGMIAHSENAQQRSFLARDLHELIGPSCLDRLGSE